MKALVVLTLLAGTAHAERWSEIAERWKGGVTLHYELTGLRTVDGDRMDPDLVLAGARIGGFLGHSGPLCYVAAIDLLAGSTISGGGFAYDVAIYPLGIGVRLGATGVFGVSTGIGASGAVGTIDDGMLLPATVLFEAGRSWRLLGRARVAYVIGADARHAAETSLGFADELDAMLAIRIGHEFEWNEFKSGNGYFVGASYREQAGTRFTGITLGYSIDGALPRRTSP